MHFYTCKRCGKNYRTPMKHSKICLDCRKTPYGMVKDTPHIMRLAELEELEALNVNRIRISATSM